MPGWLGARMRSFVLGDFGRELEATKLRVKILEQDSKDAWKKLTDLEDSAVRLPPKGDA